MNHIAAIHVIKSQLKLSEDDYRFYLNKATGLASCSAMNSIQLAQARAYFDGMATRSGIVRQASNPAQKQRGQTLKINQLWHQLADIGALNDPTAKGLRAFVLARSKSGVSSPQFLPNHEASAIIEALKSMLARAQKKAA